MPLWRSSSCRPRLARAASSSTTARAIASCSAWVQAHSHVDMVTRYAVPAGWLVANGDRDGGRSDMLLVPVVPPQVEEGHTQDEREPDDDDPVACGQVRHEA